MKKRSMALLMAGLMIGSSVFSGYTVKAEASTTAYVSVDDLEDNNTEAPAADEVIPDANQYRYQKEELSAFCHFGPNTFNEIEWGENYGDKTPSQIFTLTENFDAEKLVSTLKEAGFEKLIVTAKHHDGFCIWNSEYTDYCVKNTTYATYNYDDMGGDILAEISAACTEYDMDMGLYLSPWDIHEPSYGYYDQNGNATTKENDYLDYNDYYNNQLEEILSNDKYGNNGHFTEVWMDGAKGSGANAQEYDFVRWFNTIQKYQGIEAGYDADCMLFGAQAYTTVRWIGNENGYAHEETWSKSKVNKASNTIDSNTVGSYTKGYENGNQWTVPEVDARITSGWFWGTQKCTPKSITDLGDMYFNSVGHNGVLLLNVPPNNKGTVDDAILKRVTEFGDEIEETFSYNMAKDAEIYATEVRGNDVAYTPANVVDGDDASYWTTNDGTTEGSLIVKFDKAKTFDVVSIEESIEFGQRITSFKVEYRNGDDQEWKTFDQGTTVGAKRLSRKTAVKADQLKITVSTASTVNSNPAVPMINEIGIYKASEGFELASAAPSGMDIIDIKDSQFSYAGTWHSETGQQYINGTNIYANGNPNGSVYTTLTFTGTKAYIIGTLDPNHGTADIYIDGEYADSIDTYRTSRSVGQIIYESDTLDDGEHTLKLVVTKANKAIGMEAAYVINNGNLGMVGIEETKYTMEEDSEMEVKLVRVGGTEGDVTVTLSPNPGSAIQDDFDTELIQTVTFEEGETEATALVRTRRNTNKTGDQYFTVELSCANEDVILGFNTKAKVTILDTESQDAPTGDYTYTSARSFVLPSTVGDMNILEAEHMELHNTGSNEQWPLQITESDWASNGRFVNAMNTGDSLDLYYEAPVAGKYKATVTYRSGDSQNGFSWEEKDGKITAGSVTMGADDKAQATHTGEFEFEVLTAGKGKLTFTAGSANAPQLDKFEIVLVEKTQAEVNNEVVRLSGTNRYETGIAVADELKAVLGVEKFDTAIIATGSNYADALSGSYLAAVKNAPILLTNGKAANVAELHAYIKANVKAGATIYVLGGTAAVSKEAATIDGYTTERLSGTNRYETNLAILKEAGLEGDDLLVATGKDFADSLSASAAARPILLVKPSTTLNDAQKAIAENFKNIYVIGGTGAVSASVENELKAYGTVTRLSGSSRYETSVAVANAFFTEPETVVLAYGKNFPDGLCGGALAAALNAPLVLTRDGSEAAATAYVAENGITSGYVLGGTGALTDDTVVTVFGLESAEDIK